MEVLLAACCVGALQGSVVWRDEARDVATDGITAYVAAADMERETLPTAPDATAGTPKSVVREGTPLGKRSGSGSGRSGTTKRRTSRPAPPPTPTAPRSPPAETPGSTPPAGTPRTTPPAEPPRTTPPAETPRTTQPVTVPETTPPATAPAPTLGPQETLAPTTPTPPTSQGSDGVPFWVWILVTLGVLGVLGGAAAVYFSRRPRAINVSGFSSNDVVQSLELTQLKTTENSLATGV